MKLIGTLQMAEMEEPSRQFGNVVGDGEVQIPSTEEEMGAVALVLDLAKESERVSLPVVWAWATSASQGRS